MAQNYLKFIRIIVASVVLALSVFIFIDISGIVTGRTTQIILFLQFTPSFLKFIQLTSVGASGFILTVLLTMLFGRVYCSWFCPLGILQDLFIRIGKVFIPMRKANYSFKKANNILRYSLLGIVIIYFVAFNAFTLNLLDPYSVFGKIVSGLFKPVYALANNTLVAILERFDIYKIYPVNLRGFNWLTLIFPSIMLILLVSMSILRGRLYCNTICPVGSLLGVISKISLFRITFDKQACIGCNSCTSACKAECIDSKNHQVDASRCVACHNCIKACNLNGIKYRNGFRQKPKRQNFETDQTKREFVAKSIAYFFAFFGIKMTLQAQHKSSLINNESMGLIPVSKTQPITPPGSFSIEHMKDKCTACHLCVSKCPMHVLKPSFLEYGFTGMLIPHMDYSVHYCNYECTLCSDVCPTGAIKSISVDKKKTTQMGKVKFIKSNCIVITENTACGACSEHCPTQAVTMLAFKDGLTLPQTQTSFCIGCGACEFACPVFPHKAIYVESNPVHMHAQLPSS